MRWKKELRDQSLHAAGGFVAALPFFWLYGHVLTIFVAIAAAAGAGWAREKLQAWRSYDDVFGWKRWVDVAAWVPGGVACWALFYFT